MQSDQADMTVFDFDEWAALADGSPELFERKRNELIRETIEQAPECCKKRLHGLQFQVDMVRRVSRHPMGSCVRISRMMMDSLVNGAELIEAERQPGSALASKPTCPVVPLKLAARDRKSP